MRTGNALKQVEMRKVSMNFHFCRYFVLLIDLNFLFFFSCLKLQHLEVIDHLPLIIAVTFSLF